MHILIIFLTRNTTSSSGSSDLFISSLQVDIICERNGRQQNGNYNNLKSCVLKNRHIQSSLLKWVKGRGEVLPEIILLLKLLISRFQNKFPHEQRDQMPYIVWGKCLLGIKNPYNYAFNQLQYWLHYFQMQHCSVKELSFAKFDCKIHKRKRQKNGTFKFHQTAPQGPQDQDTCSPY